MAQSCTAIFMINQERLWKKTAFIISKSIYKYDNYKNPYLISRMLGLPGLYTNSNNIIETKTIRYDNTPGIDKQ